MKTFSVLAVAALVAGTGLSNGKFINREPTEKKNQLAFGTNATIDTVPPANISTSFSTRYPNATNVKWYSYRPAVTIEPGMWYSNLGPDDYYVSFGMEDGDYIAWYDNGNWIYSTQSIDNSDLPDAVRSKINSEYPGFVVTDVDKEHDAKQMLYEVKLQKANQRWNVHYTPTGEVFKKKQRDLKPATAETTMTSDFDTRFPGATNVVWYRYDPVDRVEVLPGDWNYNMDANDYEVVYMLDGSQYVAYYDNGSWIHSDAYMFDRTKLPSAVTNAINSQYAGYAIKDVSREDNRNQVVYEVELTKGSDKCKIHYGADGNIVKKKCRTGGLKTKS